MTEHIPKVSIGMPVYNGAKVIKQALDSLLTQTFRDFEIIISDNASIDETEAICREYAEKDKRIIFYRQPQNFGALFNFKFVLDKSRGEYFMWAACDDIRSKDFIEQNLNFLEANPDYVASISPVRFENNKFDAIKMGCFSLDADTPEQRIVEFFNGWHANGRFYSLYKRDVLLSIDHVDMFGADWIVVLQVANKGKLRCIDKGELILGKKGFSNTKNVFTQYNTNLLNFLFPFNKLFVQTFKLLPAFNFKNRITLYKKFLFLSFQAIKLNIKWSILDRRA